MYRHFVPDNLCNQAEALVSHLTRLTKTPKACPFCQHSGFYKLDETRGYYRCKFCKKGFSRGINTPFHRLIPLEWLPLIARRRLCGYGYAAIRHELGCSAQTAKKRVKAIEQLMAQDYTELYQWYIKFVTQKRVEQLAQPEMVKLQVQQLKIWITEKLVATKAICPFCGSQDKPQRVSQSKRAYFRCRGCWRYFNSLKGTGLEHLQHSDRWFDMIDMLVDGKSSQLIEDKFDISSTTVVRTRRNWIKIIENQGLLVLKEWIIGFKKG